jgi:hypothetical protein
MGSPYFSPVSEMTFSCIVLYCTNNVILSLLQVSVMIITSRNSLMVLPAYW